MLGTRSVARRVFPVFGTLLFLGLPVALAAQAQEAAPPIDNTKVAMDTMWTLLTAFLVFFMNLGFAMVESGLCRAKNTVNILAKNYIVFAVSSVAFLLIGFGLMFGAGNGFVGTSGIWFVGGADNSPLTGDAYSGVYGSLNWTSTPLWAKGWRVARPDGHVRFRGIDGGPLCRRMGGAGGSDPPGPPHRKIQGWQSVTDPRS